MLKTVNNRQPDQRGNVNIPDYREQIERAMNPVGSVTLFAGSVAPAGWLVLDGSAVSRTQYAELFHVLGTSYGVGDGSTTFNLPDMRGRVPVGAGQGSGLTNRARGAQGGSENAITVSHAHGASAGNDSPDHAHASSITDGAGGHTHTLAHDSFFKDNVAQSPASWVDAGAAGNTTNVGTSLAGGHNHSINNPGATARHSHGITVNSAGSSGTGANMQPFLALNYIIKF